MTEVWKLIGIADKYDTYGFAEVSNLGRVKDKKGKIKTPILDKDGYIRVAFFKGKRNIYKFVHRLVALAFIENTYDKKQVNHIDSNRQNNKVENLEWCSNYENVQHSIKHGKGNQKGELNANSKLKEWQVHEIRNLWDTKKYNVNTLAKKYNVSWNLVKLIVTNKIWKNI